MISFWNSPLQKKIKIRNFESRNRIWDEATRYLNQTLFGIEIIGKLWKCCCHLQYKAKGKYTVWKIWIAFSCFTLVWVRYLDIMSFKSSIMNWIKLVFSTNSVYQLLVYNLIRILILKNNFIPTLLKYSKDLSYKDNLSFKKYCIAQPRGLLNY